MKKVLENIYDRVKTKLLMSKISQFSRLMVVLNLNLIKTRKEVHCISWKFDPL